MGLTDVTVQNYLPANNPASLTYQLYNPALNAGVRTFNYLNTAYPDANNRLRINTAPSPADTGYASWAIGQGHAILAPSCSEVIVDFAADLNGNGRIDMNGGSGDDLSGAIIWYDALKFGGNIVWQRPSDPQYQPFLSINADTKAFIFRVDDAKAFDSADVASGSSTWPYLIRIRYRLHDTRGRLTSNDPGALTDGIDNDGDGEIDETDEDRISGRWYEHIVKVPRPDPV